MIVGSFNTMVEALDERIQRDARFAADVAHELRSPVTTLMTSISLLRSADDAAAGRRGAALDLVDREVRRLYRALEHLLELGRLDATAASASTECVDVADLVDHALAESHRSPQLVTRGGGSMVVRADKQVLHRALVNLFDNADLHGGGLRGRGQSVTCGAGVEVRVVDAGPGRASSRTRADLREVRAGGFEGVTAGYRPGPEPGRGDRASGRGQGVVRAESRRGRDLRAEPPGGASGGGGRGMTRPTCRSRWRRLVAFACVLTAGCGVPSDSEAQAVPVVPYGLLSPSGPTPSTSTSAAARGPRVWLVRDDRLVPAEAPSPGPDPTSTATGLLRRLAAGPTEQERADGLSTAFGPGVELTLTEVTGGHAVVDIRAGDLAPSPSRLPLAVGQLVLTLASVDGIDDVVLTAAGSPIQAPLPGGALTDRPLRADDYAALRFASGHPTRPASTATGPASPTP